VKRSVIPPELRDQTLDIVTDAATRSRITMASAGAAEDPCRYRLVVSGRSDPTARALVQYCIDHRLPVRHLWLDNLVFRWKPMVALVDNASGIYFRGISCDEHNGQVLQAVRSAVIRHPNIVIPAVGCRNWSKPMQAAQMLAIDNDNDSLPVRPVPSRLTNMPPARTDAQIVKSISAVHSVVVATSHSALGWCDSGVRLAHPVQVQPRLLGVNIRVHVIGESVFACTIVTDAIDYRYGSEPIMNPIELPVGVKTWCIEKTRYEGLRFSGIDLLRDRDGTYFCFEINPMPGYEYYERRAFSDTRPISGALARELAGHAGGQSR
jgi:hypothetical protein